MKLGWGCPSCDDRYQYTIGDERVFSFNTERKQTGWSARAYLLLPPLFSLSSFPFSLFSSPLLRDLFPSVTEESSKSSVKHARARCSNVSCYSKAARSFVSIISSKSGCTRFPELAEHRGPVKLVFFWSCGFWEKSMTFLSSRKTEALCLYKMMKWITALCICWCFLWPLGGWDEAHIHV